MKAYKFCGLLLGATVVLTPSCSQQEEAPVLGAEQTVTFTAQLPGRFTRAAGDGTKANTLKCFVYDSKGDFIESHVGNMANAQGSVSMRLASGMDYKLVFWADTKLTDSPYSITDAGVLTVDYAKMTGNDDTMDAFYLSTTYHAGNSTSESVILKRPFAQVNFGTDDLNLDVVKKAYSNGVRTTVALEAYTEMNLVSGKASKPISLTTNVGSHRDLTSERFPAGQGATAADDLYSYLNMGYVLVPSEGTTGEITLNSYNVDPQGGTDPLWTIKVPNAPLRPNFRTNIFGSLLTTRTNFQVTIDSDFTGEVVTSIASLRNVAAKTGQQTSILSTNMENETLDIPAKSASAPLEMIVDNNGQMGPNVIARANVTYIVYDSNPIKLPSSTRTRTRAVEDQYRYTALDGSTIKIMGGTYNSPSGRIMTQEGTGIMKVYEGTFVNQDPTPYLAENSVVDETNGVYRVLDMSKIDSAEKLIRAMNEAKDGEVIKVVKSFDMVGMSQTLTVNAKNVTLEIPAGVTIRQEYSSNLSEYKKTEATKDQLIPNYDFITINAGASLTITGNGSIETITKGFRVNGELTVNGGNISSRILYDYSLIYVEDGGKMTLNDGNLFSASRTIGVYGSFTMNGGKVKSDGTKSYNIATMSNSANAVFNGGEVESAYGALALSRGNWVINGGWFHSYKKNGARAFYALYVDDWGNEIHGTINGGLFYAEGTTSIYLCDAPDVKIKGGKFGNKGYYSEYGPLDVYDFPVPLAEGYKWKQINENPFNWQVVKDDSAPAVASAPKKAKTRAAIPSSYRRINTGGSR